MKALFTGLFLMSSLSVKAETFSFECSTLLYSSIGIENEYKVNFKLVPARPADNTATVFQNGARYEDNVAYVTGNASEKVFAGKHFLITVPISIERDRATRMTSTYYQNKDLDGVMLLSAVGPSIMEKVKCNLVRIVE